MTGELLNLRMFLDFVLATLVGTEKLVKTSLGAYNSRSFHLYLYLKPFVPNRLKENLSLLYKVKG